MSEIAQAEQRIEQYVETLVTHPQQRLNLLWLRQLLSNLEQAVWKTPTPF